MIVLIALMVFCAVVLVVGWLVLTRAIQDYCDRMEE